MTRLHDTGTSFRAGYLVGFRESFIRAAEPPGGRLTNRLENEACPDIKILCENQISN